MVEKKIVTYNVNGIRAAMKKGFLDWLTAFQPDVLCLQETKAQTDQLPLFEFAEAGYHCYHLAAKKKGYSGVAILTKEQPDHVEVGMNIPTYDDEGRFLRADYGDTSVVSVYHPSGSMGDERQAFKMKWLDDFQQYVDQLKKSRPKLIICGDFNICHEAIDIHDPKRNADKTGFLPEERAWIDSFIKSGFIDGFRHFHQGVPDQYTWWSYRTSARERNLGWRIDYNMVSEPMRTQLISSKILADVNHSDHCPSVININF